MELKVIKQPKLVVALDIGTTYSGYAWQSRAEYEANPNDVHFNTNWGSGALQLHKTSTCILLICPTNEEGGNQMRASYADLNIKGKIETRIGHEAERKYTKLSKTEDISKIEGQYYFFKGFKMLLYRKDFHRELLVEDQIGQQLPLFDVMSLFIKALKDHCLNKLKKEGNEIEPDRTLFVVTVPAIWSEEAKNFMRDAAMKTGIEENNVLLALEPEVAAIYCLHLPEEKRREMNDLGMKGQKFLVADLGGGTADLSAVKVEDEDDLFLDEICPPLGNNVGGQKINEAFLQVCCENFEGNEWKNTFSKVTPVEMMKMESDFEKKKVTIGTDDPDDEFIDIEFPAQVRDKLQDGTITLKEGNYLKFDMENREMMFNSSLIRDKLFKETCRVIYTTISNVLNREESKGLKTIVLVGGFSESPIVISTLREMICNDYPDINVFVPSSPFKAVLMGAVLFGHDPFKFKSRISRYTFGISTNSKFNAKVHDEGKKWYNEEEGIYYCKELFDIHVRKDQSVLLGSQQPTKSYIPLYKTQKQIGLPIYSSTSLDPKYVTDEGCKNIGKITVDIPDSSSGADREAEVTMIYGGTQLSVVAKDKATGREYKANISFNNE